MYNIFTVLNSYYMPFGKIFMGSLYRNVDLSHIENIYIADTGLSEEDKRFLSTYDKVVIYPTEVKTPCIEDIHGPEWHKNIDTKVSTFKKILKETKKTLVMIDADSMFVEDFSSLINGEFDIQVCFRVFYIPYIASFFSANFSEEVIKFLDEWEGRKNEFGFIEATYEPGKFFPRESAALSCVVRKFLSQYKIDIKSEMEVSTTPAQYLKNLELKNNTKIIHFKSSALDIKRGRYFPLNEVLNCGKSSPFFEISAKIKEILKEKR